MTAAAVHAVPVAADVDQGPGFKYNRPLDGQPEERWWNALPLADRRELETQLAIGLSARRVRWNATHAPDRQIPRDVGR